ncbi:MAG: hypothetical protein AAF593_02370, partial [Planctomycetota bacterium]
GAVTRSMDVGLDGVDTSTTGAKSGLITIDNLDITTDGGAGVGDNDADDFIVVTTSVVSQRVVTASAVDLGTSLVGAGVSGATTLSTTGSDDERTRVVVAASSTGSTEVAANNAGGIQFFDEATDITDWDVTATFNTAGAKAGSVDLGVLSAENGFTGLAGEGSYDAVQVDYAATVLDHAVASLDGSVVDTELTLDFGTLTLGDSGGLASLDFDIFNLEQTAGFTADLDITALQPVTGNTATLALDPIPGLVAAGSSLTAAATFDTSALGAFSATWEILTADQALPGAAASNTLSITLLGDIIAALLHGDFNDDGLVTIADIDGFLAALAAGAGATQAQIDLGDFNDDGLLTIADIDGFLAAIAGPLAAADIAQFQAAGIDLAAIPEPTAACLSALGFFALGCRRRAPTTSAELTEIK